MMAYCSINTFTRPLLITTIMFVLFAGFDDCVGSFLIKNPRGTIPPLTKTSSYNMGAEETDVINMNKEGHYVRHARNKKLPPPPCKPIRRHGFTTKDMKYDPECLAIREAYLKRHEHRFLRLKDTQSNIRPTNRPTNRPTKRTTTTSIPICSDLHPAKRHRDCL